MGRDGTAAAGKEVVVHQKEAGRQVGGWWLVGWGAGGLANDGHRLPLMYAVDGRRPHSRRRCRGGAPARAVTA